MFADIKKSYDLAASAVHADGIIPSGRTMQLLVENGLVAHRDTFHANLGYGRYALGLAWYGTIFGKDVLGDAFDSLDEPADEKTLEICRKAAAKACAEYANLTY